jgi:hypothetical protein
VEHIYRERTNMAASLKDTDSIVQVSEAGEPAVTKASGVQQQQQQQQLLLGVKQCLMCCPATHISLTIS